MAPKKPKTARVKRPADRVGKTSSAAARSKKSKSTAPARTGAGSPSRHDPKVITGAMSASSAAATLAAQDSRAVPFLLLFGTYGVALSITMTLALDALRPAAKTFGERLAAKLTPTACTSEATALGLQHQLKANPRGQRAVLEGVRRLMDSVAEEAARPLADLTAEYVRGRKVPDGFFRGAARMLADMTADELAMLTDLVMRIAPTSRMGTQDERLFMFARLTDAPGPRRLKYRRPHQASDADAGTDAFEWFDLGSALNDDEPLLLAVIRRLKLNGLAGEHLGGGFLGVSGDAVLAFDASTLTRLHDLMQADG